MSSLVYASMLTANHIQVEISCSTLVLPALPPACDDGPQSRTQDPTPNPAHTTRSKTPSQTHLEALLPTKAVAIWCLPSIPSSAQHRLPVSRHRCSASAQTPRPVRNTMAALDGRTSDSRMGTPPATYTEGPRSSRAPSHPAMSPSAGPTPKSVAFELLFPESPQYRARLPMRVQIFPHDTTESIVTTVKNFYGLYAGPSGARGVSFEDEQGNTLIARYENLRNNMVVYVRVIDEPSPPPGAYGPSSYHSGSPALPDAYYPGDLRMAPPQPAQALSYGQLPQRPTSRTSRKRSISPNGGRGRRSTSVSTNPLPTKKSRSRSGFKSRGSSAHGSFADNHSDAVNGYSSGDGAPGSVSSRTKSEHLGNTEISLDNIVEGGRRKRAKFESSVSAFEFAMPAPSITNYSIGAAPIRAAADACSRFQLLCLARSSPREPEGLLPIHNLIAQSLLQPTPPTISSDIRQRPLAAWGLHNARRAWSPHSWWRFLPSERTGRQHTQWQ